MIKVLWLILFACICVIVFIELDTQTGGELSKIRIYSDEDGSIYWIKVFDKDYCF